MGIYVTVFIGLFILLIFIIYLDKVNSEATVYEASLYLLKKLEYIKKSGNYYDDSSSHLHIFCSIDYVGIDSTIMARKNQFNKELKLNLKKFLKVCVDALRSLKDVGNQNLNKEELETFLNELEQFQEMYNKRKFKNEIRVWFVIGVVVIAVLILTYLFETSLINSDDFYKDLAMLNATFSVGVGTLLLTISNIERNVNSFKQYKIMKFISFEFPTFFLTNILLLSVTYLKMPFSFEDNEQLLFLGRLIKMGIICGGFASTIYIVFRLKSLFKTLISNFK